MIDEADSILVSFLVSVSDATTPIPVLHMQLELEARVGIEPTHRGFADLGLTTWLPRLTPRTSHASTSSKSVNKRFYTTFSRLQINEQSEKRWERTGFNDLS